MTEESGMQEKRNEGEQDDVQQQMSALRRQIRDHEERHGMTIDRMSDQQRKAGTMYVSIASILSLSLAVSGWLVVHAVNSIDLRLAKLEDKQMDMRERLRGVEDDVEQLNRIINHFGENRSNPREAR